MHKLETTLLVSLGGGDAEKEFERLIVEYSYSPYRRARVPRGEYLPLEPDDPEMAEIYRVYVLDEKKGAMLLPEWMVDAMSEDLERLCCAEARENEADARAEAAERRYEDRREELMFERKPQAAE